MNIIKGSSVYESMDIYYRNYSFSINFFNVTEDRFLDIYSRYSHALVGSEGGLNINFNRTQRKISTLQQKVIIMLKT